jgi:hypothetical protein
VRVTLERAAQYGMVESERDTQHRRARGQGPFERDAEPPALRISGLEQGVRAGRAEHRGVARREQETRAAVADGLGRADRQHEVGLDEAAVDAHRHVPGGADLDEVVALDVVHLDAAAETSCEVGRDELLEPLAVQARREPGGHEQGLALGRDAARNKRLDRRFERRAPRIAEHARERERGRLDHHRRSPTPGRRLFERRPGQREPQRVSDRRADVVDCGGRRRRAQDDGVLRCVEVLDARARKQGNPRQRSGIA